MLKSVFGEALNRVPGPDRAAYLDAACRGDADLRAQVEELLRDRARLGGFLASEPGLATGSADEMVPYDPAAPAEPAVLPEPFGGISRLGRHDTEIDLGVGPPPCGSSPATPGPDDRTGRYQLLGEIARGGMGAVFRARDPDLGRDIAVKVLLDEHRDDPRLVRRFVEEARIGGQLEHPGILPIYGLGTLADRRPFFAMRLVRGRTLSELLARRPDPAADRSRFLAIFEAVCQAVAFAHARGVIHRDLKPANIMVGSFGEVQVMDWGLAKVLPRPRDERGEAEPADTAVADRLIEPEVNLSRADRIMGTPSYMAPEQATVGSGRVDERSDVFALGSILSEVLTGRPAFAGHDTHEILRRLVRGDLTEAFDRLDSCGSDPDLVALARRCLAAEPSERPRDAREVATAVTTYLATVQERLRAAELARVEAQARAVEERKRRRLVVTSAAVVMLLASLAGASWLRIAQGRAARDAGAAHALADANRLRELARKGPLIDIARLGEAIAAAERAGAALGDEGGSARRHIVQAMLADLTREKQEAERDREMLARLSEIRSFPAQNLPDSLAADVAYARAFADYGIAIDGLAESESAARIRARPGAVATELTAALDDWIALRRRLPPQSGGGARLLEIARRADPDPFRCELRAVLAHDDRRASAAALKDLADRAAIGELPVASLCSLAEALAEVGEGNLARALLEDARWRSPGDVWINYALGRLFQAARTSSPQQAMFFSHEAIRYFTAAQAVRPGSGHALAHALQGRGQDRDAIAIFRGLTRANPKNGHHQFCLGDALRRKGLTREAADAFCSAAEGYRAILEVFPEHAGSHYNRAMALHGAGQLDEAIAEYRTALRLKLDEDRVHLDLGRALAARGRLDEAIAEYHAALRRNSTLAEAHYALGRALHDRGQLDAAIGTYRSALGLGKNDAEIHNALGVALQQRGKRDEAIAEFRTAVRLDRHHAEARRNFADSLREKSRLDEAIAEYVIAVRLNPVDASTRCQLARTYRDLGELDEAIAEYRAAFRYDPCDAETHFDLVRILWRRGRLAEAIAEFRAVLRLRADLDRLCHRVMKALSPEGPPMRNRLAPTLLGLALGVAASARPAGDERVAQARPSVSDEIALTFRGLIDGSGQIKITQEAATWRQNHWPMPPEPVSINDIPWYPREQRVLKNEGMSRFLRSPVDFRSARLERVQGRDTIAFERGKGYVIVHLVDTPFEGSIYEFRLIFRPLRGTAPVEADVARKRASLEVAAEIAGSDELHINAQGARWVHHEWDWPAEVRLGEIKWRPRESPTLKNEGTTRFLGGPVDFSKARLARKVGRDTAVMEHVEGGLVIYFADSLLGPSHYELTITFDD